MAGVAALAALGAAARACQLATPSFTDEHAAQGLAIADELRARFLPPDPVKQAASLLLQLPAELLTVILSRLNTRDLARLAATCVLLWSDAPTPPPPRDIGPVEAELRWRAEARFLDVGSSLPDSASSWVPYLLKRDRRDAQMRQAPIAVGPQHSIFVDKGGRLLTCGRDIDGTPLLGHAVDPNAEPFTCREISSPTPVPSMQNRRIVSVATSDAHSLALSADGEVYSWGCGDFCTLGHGDMDDLAVPRKIESLSRIKFIAAGPHWMSAAVDEAGLLFTWGKASFFDEGDEDSDGEQEFDEPNGLGYEFDYESSCAQPTPEWVDALSQDRVVGVALGNGFTLAVTDAGEVFSFGFSRQGALGLGSLERTEVPRRIQAPAEMGRVVSVAAGSSHAIALTEGGEVYRWGAGNVNGHGRVEYTPHRVAALIGRRVKIVLAQGSYSCAVTEKGELFTWGVAWLGDAGGFGTGVSLGGFLSHSVAMPQATPKRVEALVRTRIAAVAMGCRHTLVADEDGVVWALGGGWALGLGGPNPEEGGLVVWAFGGSPGLGGPNPERGGLVNTPTPIPTLRVRTLISP